MERDSRGRFAPGHAGGPGRPRRATEAEYIEQLCFAVPLERWRKIADALATRAEKGDVRAALALASYLCGAPPTRAQTALNIDMSKLTDGQLERIANGEDPLVVLSSESATGAGTAGTTTTAAPSK